MGTTVSHASASAVSRNFAEYVNRVAYLGERFVITRGGKPVAELRPLPRGGRLGDLAQVLASLPRLGAAEAEALAADLDALRSAAGADQEAQDPWDS